MQSRALGTCVGQVGHSPLWPKCSVEAKPKTSKTLRLLLAPQGFQTFLRPCRGLELYLDRPLPLGLSDGCTYIAYPTTCTCCLKAKVSWNRINQSQGFSVFVCFPQSVMTSLGPAFQECTGSCHVNVPSPNAVSSQSAFDRWSDCIGRDRDSHHFGTLSTILQQFTHNEISLWSPVTYCCLLMSLCAAVCILHAKLTSLNT